MKTILATLREFILWLSQQEGFRRGIKPADADYFNLSRRDEAEARAATRKPAPSVSQAKRALAAMPSSDPRELRDKAIFALLCLTGDRGGALISLRLKNLDLIEKSITQDPREVANKCGKRIDTFFAKGFSDAETALAAWMTHLDQVELYGPDDPLFPSTMVKSTSNAGFAASGFSRSPCSGTGPINEIVRNAFERIGQPNYGPHAFRHMLARHAVNNAKSVAEFVANSQNLGHTDVLTTLRSYGQISRERQRALITGESEKKRWRSRLA